MDIDALNRMADRNFCLKWQDLQSKESYKLLRLTCGKFLDAQTASVTELLYYPNLQQKFDNMGDLKNTVAQKVAIAQVKKSGKDVQERLKELHAIVDELIHRTNNKETKEKIIVLDLEKPNAGLDVYLSLEDETEQLFFMGSAIAKHIYEHETIEEKIEKLANLSDLIMNEQIQDLLDMTVADFFCDTHKMWSGAFDGVDNNAQKIWNLVDLIQGNDVRDPINTPLFQNVVKLCKQCYMSESRAALSNPLLVLISSKKSQLSESGELIHELKEINKLFKMTESRPIPGYNEEIQKTLTSRMMNMMDYEAIQQELYNLKTDLERISQALAFYELSIESNSKKAITTIIKGLINKWNPKNDFISLEGDMKQKVTFLTNVSVKLIKSRLPETIRRDYEKKLGEMA